METKQTFASIITLEEFLNTKGIKANAIKVAKTTNGSTVLTANGSLLATIKKELVGETPQQTVQNLSVVNLCFGMPHDDSVDQKGRPSLPCVMESKTQWEEVTLF